MSSCMINYICNCLILILRNSAVSRGWAVYCSRSPTFSICTCSCQYYLKKFIPLKIIHLAIYTWLHVFTSLHTAVLHSPKILQNKFFGKTRIFVFIFHKMVSCWSKIHDYIFVKDILIMKFMKITSHENFGLYGMQ